MTEQATGLPRQPVYTRSGKAKTIAPGRPPTKPAKAGQAAKDKDGSPAD